jgi:hypothetical protein
VREGESGIDANGLILVGDNLVEFLLVLPDVAAVIVSTSVSRIETNRLSVVGDRAVWLPLAAPDSAACVLRVAVLRIKSGRLAQVFDRLVKFYLGCPGSTAQEPLESPAILITRECLLREPAPPARAVT